MPFTILPPGVPPAKRGFDLLITLPGLILVSPVLAMAAAAIWLTEGRPLLFRQPRLSRLGRFLRASSVDDLPNLINVLRGEMSLVGPRPLLVKYIPLYSAEQMRRHDALPGITGWAQINGRNALSWDDKFRLDVWYVDHWSLWLDVKILALTLWKVIKREGINEPGQSTAQEFTGNN
jgi:sugar transferase EpsL